jgi:hypothetical protein
MTRTFIHTFDPPLENPVAGRTVDLTVQEIEDAGLKEVLQTPGAALGSWALLDTLLEPTGDGTPFIFREPLGQSREVKVALSGLFGRFVARAYLTRYFGLSIFCHLHRNGIRLYGRRRIGIRRKAPGDLPDWVSCAADLSNLTIAEAKGSHDPSGPNAALNRAWNQAHRIDVLVGSRRVSVKRVAIVTRWGCANGGPDGAHISVRDPEDDGDPITPEEEASIFFGLLRHHIAGLIAPLGHSELAKALRDLASARFRGREQRATDLSHEILGRTNAQEFNWDPDSPPIDAMIGAVVTRPGAIIYADLSEADQDALDRLDLRPVFVGVERNVIKAAIEGDLALARGVLTDVERNDRIARADSAGGWIVPLGPGMRTMRIP